MTDKKFAPVLCVFSFTLICTLTMVKLSNAELFFNINSLELTEEQREGMDLDMLSRTDIQIPGTYEVAVKVNNSYAGKLMLNFVECNNALCPELTPETLQKLGVNVKVIPGLKDINSENVITGIGDYIPDADESFDFNLGVLSLSIPQAALDKSARGYIHPDQWDDGLPMAFISYSASGAETHNRLTGERESTQYVNLRNGINVGPWRVRNTSYFQNHRSGSEWKTLQSWLERDIRSLRSRLVAGETGSPGLIFDSFRFRGVSLSTQDGMLPDSMRGYAPQITGIALTNAVVEIRQNGNLLYQTFVPPGEFIINDLFATSTSGELEIIVREEGGAVRIWTQSFASPPISVRKGAFKYSITAGEFGSKYYNREDTLAQHFAQSELLYGVLSDTSIYAGMIAAEHYRSGMVGVGQGLGMLGAVSLDVTHAEASFNSNEKQQGQSWRVRYSKKFDTTGTSMTLAGYRYATDGYYDFDEATNSFYTHSKGNRTVLKNRAQLTLNQNIGSLGSVSLSANQMDYWYGDSNRTRNITGSWSKTFGSTAVSLNHSQNKIWNTGKTDNVTALNISLPIGEWLSGQTSSVRMNNTYTRSNKGDSALVTTLSGTALEDNNASWSASQSYSKHSSGETANSTAVSGTYRSGVATLNMGYSNYFGESQRINWGMQGAVVAHPYGVTLAQPLSEGSSYALVQAPGAENVKVKNGNGLKTDSRGYTIIPSMMAYRDNRIAVDTTTLPDNVDLLETFKSAVPTREALVLADFNTQIGFRALLTLRYKGQTVPFGSTVSADDSQGVVDDKGQVYLSGLKNNAELTVLLPGGKRCGLTFDASKALDRNGLMMMEAVCN